MTKREARKMAWGVAAGMLQVWIDLGRDPAEAKLEEAVERLQWVCFERSGKSPKSVADVLALANPLNVTDPEIWATRTDGE